MKPPTAPRLLVIAGPTASGKTALAVDLAERLNGELIGADSVQVYRGLDLGSAKPTAQELRGVTHHLLDVCDLEEPFDAGRYVTLADRAIAETLARGRVPIVVGGAGLYLRALVRGLAQGIPSDPTLRAALNERASKGAEELARMHDELAAVDPAYAAKIHRTDPIRIVRALEVFALSGEPISSHHRRHAAEPARYEALFVGLDVPRPVLAERIAKRARAMLVGGWVDEVRALLAAGRAWDLKALRSVGYAEVVAHLRGELAAAELEETIVKSTREFAKRQRTWFRGERGVSWRAPEAVATEDFAREAEKFFRGEAASAKEG
jgi:tRNA dimethylallyltransferase